jgi:diguanylate cyclase (GGDEF)-like protein
MTSRLFGAARSAPRVLVWVLTFAALGGLGLGARATHAAAAFTALALVPIVFGAWFGGVTLGSLAALLSCVLWVLLERGVHGREGLALWSSAVQLAVFLALAWGVRRGREALTLERGRSRVDALTGLLTRQELGEAAQRTLRARAPLAVLYLDVDHFKQVNDSCGHAAGDALLRLVGRVLREELRAVDLAARLGGDEFAVLLPNTDAAQAAAVSLRLEERLTTAARAAQFPVGFSFGVAATDAPRASLQQLVDQADRCMYAVKQARAKGQTSLLRMSIALARS